MDPERQSRNQTGQPRISRMDTDEQEQTEGTEDWGKALTPAPESLRRKTKLFRIVVRMDTDG